MKRLFGGLAFLAVLAVAAGIAWQFRGELRPAAPGIQVAAKRALPVELAKVVVGPVQTTLEAVATARANDAVTITPKVAGLVRRIAFQEGQRVAAGTLLVEIDSSEVKAKLEEARATRDNARQLLTRARQLLASRNVPQARVDELQAQFSAADARVRASEALLDDYSLRAPFSGRLGLRQVSLGALVKPGDPITTLDDSSTIRLEFEVPETALAAVKLGLEIAARSAAYPGRTFTGKVSAVDSRLDPVSRTIRVRADLPNPDEVLKPGMFLTVSLVAHRDPNALLVPEEAIIASAAGPYVFLVRDGKAARRPVELGLRLKGQVQVLNGLAAGDEVVVGGVQTVRDGAAVQAIPRVGAKPAAPGA